jgi:hypothetical protein
MNKRYLDRIEEFKERLIRGLGERIFTNINYLDNSTLNRVLGTYSVHECYMQNVCRLIDQIEELKGTKNGDMFKKIFSSSSFGGWYRDALKLYKKRAQTKYEMSNENRVIFSQDVLSIKELKNFNRNFINFDPFYSIFLAYERNKIEKYYRFLSKEKAELSLKNNNNMIYYKDNCIHIVTDEDQDLTDQMQNLETEFNIKFKLLSKKVDFLVRDSNRYSPLCSGMNISTNSHSATVGGFLNVDGTIYGLSSAHAVDKDDLVYQPINQSNQMEDVNLIGKCEKSFKDIDYDCDIEYETRAENKKEVNNL